MCIPFNFLLPGYDSASQSTHVLFHLHLCACNRGYCNIVDRSVSETIFNKWYFITGRKRKVMFLHLSVILLTEGVYLVRGVVLSPRGVYLVPGSVLSPGGVLSMGGLPGERGVCPGGVRPRGCLPRGRRLPRGVSAQGGVCPRGRLPRGVCPGGCLPRRGVCLGVSAQGMCLPKGDLPWGCLPGGVCGGCLPRGFPSRGGVCHSAGIHPPEIRSTRGRYASYWNAILF